MVEERINASRRSARLRSGVSARDCNNNERARRASREIGEMTAPSGIACPRDVGFMA